jgi:asparagine N-glycosylation enzyme membrane subunit Stt3
MSGVRNPLWFVLGFAALSHILLVVMGGTVFSHGIFADGDSYVRLVHLRELYETGNWFGDEFPRANAPFGTTIHWTRLFDILVSVILFPVRAFVDFETALWVAGVVISPLIYLGTVAAMAWAVRPVIGRTAAYIAGALTVTQYSVMSFSMAGRADHHIVFALLLIMTVGFMVRLLGSGTYRARDAVGLGISIALGVWIGTEVFVLIGACMMVLGLTWVWNEPDAAEKNFMVALSLTLTLAVALVMERGPGMFSDVEYDKISVVHLVLAVHMLGFWAVLRFLGDRGRAGNIPTRLIWAAAGVIVLGAVYWLQFPKFFLGPMVDIDPRLKFYWHMSLNTGSSTVCQGFLSCWARC